MKATTQEQANGLRAGGDTELPCSLIMESGQVTLPAHQCFHQLGSSTEFCASGVFI